MLQSGSEAICVGVRWVVFLCFLCSRMLFHVVPFNSLAATGAARAFMPTNGSMLDMSSFKDHW